MALLSELSSKSTSQQFGIFSPSSKGKTNQTKMNEATIYGQKIFTFQSEIKLSFSNSKIPQIMS